MERIKMENRNKNKIRAKEVAKYLGVGLSTVWLYAKEGKITPIRLSPRVTVFSVEDLDSFISKCNKEVA